MVQIRLQFLRSIYARLAVLLHAAAITTSRSACSSSEAKKSVTICPTHSRAPHLALKAPQECHEGAVGWPRARRAIKVYRFCARAHCVCQATLREEKRFAAEEAAAAALVAPRPPCITKKVAQSRLAARVEGAAALSFPLTTHRPVPYSCTR